MFTNHPFKSPPSDEFVFAVITGAITAICALPTIYALVWGI